MKLFDLTFGNNIRGAEELFRRGKAIYDETSRSLRIQKGVTLSFGTYFNLFPLYEYSRYCDIDRVALVLQAEGDYRIELCLKQEAGSCLSLYTGHYRGDCRAEVSIEQAKRGTYLYFTLTAESDCLLQCGRWETDAPPRREVKLGIVICTYRRETFVKANLSRMLSAVKAAPEWGERLHVFVIDNAQELTLEPNDFYTVIPNRNLGGSGGFARGMRELSRRREFTHMLLMDDDIRFEFSVLTRTYFLLAALSPAYADASIGGAMLKLERPCIQHEFGGAFKGLVFRSINNGLDMRKEKNLLKNQTAAKPDYNAWWYCCMPASFVRKFGLPMPFFIKSDDVEYGLRTFHTLILMSGIAVWHQDFSEKYNGLLEYYIKRNSAVTAAVHARGSRFKVALRFAYFMFKGLSLKNYDSVELIYQAYLDFKKGPTFFQETDPVRLNDWVRSKAPAFLPQSALEAQYGRIELPYARTDKRHSLIASFIMFLENYTPALFFSKRLGITDAGNPRAMDCFLKRTVIHYDPKNKTGLVLSLDPKRRAKLRRAALRTIFGLLFGYGKLKKTYQAGFSKMYAEETWNNLFFPKDLPSSPQGE